ncbi:hypothetical protein NXW97_24245 [Bacteroides faecis]|uniref:Uncharacterized protein n=1 Tax=Bacteroides faecis TaxID=674529 RepID=A0AAW5P2H2_9BACE|nr:hypothetical protein [Bacteroides faecis]MCS2795064.1 hypothetical protein [Bacteroides faecis]
MVGSIAYAAPFVPLEYEGMPASGYRGASNPDYAAGHSGYSKIRTMRLETSAKIEYSLPFLKGLKAGMFVRLGLARSRFTQLQSTLTN